MKKHTKIWLDYFGDPFCEITGRVGTTGMDIHHLSARGMGGNPNGNKDKIDNLMCCDRTWHTFVEMNPKYGWWYKLVHLAVLIYKKPYSDLDISINDPIFEEIKKQLGWTL